MLGGLRINILRLKLPRRVRNSELMEFYGYGIRIMYGRFKFWTEYRCSFHCLSIVFRLSAKVRGACDMLQLRICSDHRCFAPPLYSAQEVEPLQKLQKIIGTRDEKRTEGAMAFYDIDCNNSNNNHYHHHHYHYHHYLYKPLNPLKMFCIELITLVQISRFTRETEKPQSLPLSAIGLSVPGFPINRYIDKNKYLLPITSFKFLLKNIYTSDYIYIYSINIYIYIYILL